MTSQRWISEPVMEAERVLDLALSQVRVKLKPRLEKVAEEVAEKTAGYSFKSVVFEDGRYLITFSNEHYTFGTAVRPHFEKDIPSPSGSHHEIAWDLLCSIIPVDSLVEDYLAEAQDELEAMAGYSDFTWVRLDNVRNACAHVVVETAKMAISEDLVQVAWDAVEASAAIPTEEIVRGMMARDLAEIVTSFRETAALALRAMTLEEAIVLVREAGVTSVMEG